MPLSDPPVAETAAESAGGVLPGPRLGASVSGPSEGRAQPSAHWQVRRGGLGGRTRRGACRNVSAAWYVPLPVRRRCNVTLR